MKYLILSDIHSNREALGTILSFVKRKPWNKAVFLGDLVGYGANPNQTVDMVRKMRPLAAIRGNHDKVCSGLEEGEAVVVAGTFILKAELGKAGAAHEH